MFIWLQVLEARIDHTRVVGILRRCNAMPLAKDYLLSVQKSNLKEVNEALNQQFIEEEDFNALRSSIQTYDSFDKLALANLLELHEMLEFRRIAAFVYKKNLKWRKAVALAKQDKLYKDAMETAAQSNDPDLAEDVLRYFVEEKERECFAAMLFVCYDLLKPDVAMEIAWMNGLQDLAMPYMVQVCVVKSGSHSFYIFAFWMHFCTQRCGSLPGNERVLWQGRYAHGRAKTSPRKCRARGEDGKAARARAKCLCTAHAPGSSPYTRHAATSAAGDGHALSAVWRCTPTAAPHVPNWTILVSISTRTNHKSYRKPIVASLIDMVGIENVLRLCIVGHLRGFPSQGFKLRAVCPPSIARMAFLCKLTFCVREHVKGFINNAYQFFA